MDKAKLLGAAIVLGLLLLPFAGCSKGKEPSSELTAKKAYSATEEITSYHFTMSVVATAEGMGDIDVEEWEGDYLAPDRVHIWGTEGPEQGEAIIIGDKSYERAPESSSWTVYTLSVDIPSPASSFGGMEDLKKTLELLESPGENVVELPDEVIDGVACWYYRISIDPLKGIREALEKETDPAGKEVLKSMLEVMQKQEQTMVDEIWIGKDDYLVRQMMSVVSQKLVGTSIEVGEVTISEGARLTMTSTFKFSNFNEPMEIEPPAGAVELTP